MVKPGEVLEGPIPFTVCATINDLTQFITVPTSVIEGAIASADLIPHWPLGVFAAFNKAGVLMCIYGHNSSGELDLKTSLIELQEDVIPGIGKPIWDMWKLLRDVSEETLTANYTTLFDQSNTQSGVQA